jgi:hypothetical protein
VAQKSQFNVIQPASGLKLDLIVPADDAFNRSHLARARTVHPAPDYTACFSSPEDVILMKLDFHRRGGSDKHLRDIASILKISGNQVDRTYIDSWAEHLGLTQAWQALVKRSG